MNTPKYILLAWLTFATFLAIGTFHLPPAKKTAQTLAIGVLINVALAVLVVLA